MLRSIALYTALVFAANAAAAGPFASGQADAGAAPQPMRLAMGGKTPPAETAAPQDAAVASDAPAAAGDAAPGPAATDTSAAEPVVAPANATAGLDFAAAQAGGLAKLVETAPPAPAPAIAFSDLDGGTHSLADWKGKALLVNFWATWCAPCREEMPALDALQKARGGDRFQVLTIAAGRNAPAAINKFFADEAITDLPKLTDEKTELARAMGVLALPVTILIDANGNEVARMTGDADWSSPAALTLVDQLIGQ